MQHDKFAKSRDTGCSYLRLGLAGKQAYERCVEGFTREGLEVACHADGIRSVMGAASL